MNESFNMIFFLFVLFIEKLVFLFGMEGNFDYVFVVCGSLIYVTSFFVILKFYIFSFIVVVGVIDFNCVKNISYNNVFLVYYINEYFYFIYV